MPAVKVATCSTPEEIAAAVALTCAAFPHERAGLTESQWAELETKKLLARPSTWGHIGVAKLDGCVIGVIFLKSAHLLEGGTSFTEVSRQYGCVPGFWRWAYDNFVLEDELEDNELLVEYIAVSPAARGKGVGQALMHWAEKQGPLLVPQGPAGPPTVPMISLWVASDNRAACALYKRCGYCTVRRTSATCCPILMANYLQRFLGHPVWQKMVKTLPVPGQPPPALLEPPTPTLIPSPLSTLRRLSSATLNATATLLRSASNKFSVPTDGLADNLGAPQTNRHVSGKRVGLTDGQTQEGAFEGEMQQLQQVVAATVFSNVHQMQQDGRTPYNSALGAAQQAAKHQQHQQYNTFAEQYACDLEDSAHGRAEGLYTLPEVHNMANGDAAKHSSGVIAHVSVVNKRSAAKEKRTE